MTYLQVIPSYWQSSVAFKQHARVIPKLLYTTVVVSEFAAHATPPPMLRRLLKYVEKEQNRFEELRTQWEIVKSQGEMFLSQERCCYARVNSSAGNYHTRCVYTSSRATQICIYIAMHEMYTKLEMTKEYTAHSIKKRLYPPPPRCTWEHTQAIPTNESVKSTACTCTNTVCNGVMRMIFSM